MRGVGATEQNESQKWATSKTTGLDDPICDIMTHNRMHTIETEINSLRARTFLSRYYLQLGPRNSLSSDQKCRRRSFFSEML
jgi:hypothetical protein